MSGLLNRSFTDRERWMLLALMALLVVGVYFFAVHYPIVERMDRIEQENETLDTELAAAQAKAAEYSAMQAELAAIQALPPEEVTYLPAYSNIETLMRELDTIFAGTSADFSFSQPRITDDVAARTISFSCTASDYTVARRLLRDVAGTPYRSLLDSFTMTPVNGGDLYTSQLQLSGAITFYERMPQNEGAAQDDAAPAPAA